MLPFLNGHPRAVHRISVEGNVIRARTLVEQRSGVSGQHSLR